MELRSHGAAQPWRIALSKWWLRTELVADGHARRTEHVKDRGDHELSHDWLAREQQPDDETTAFGEKAEA